MVAAGATPIMKIAVQFSHSKGRNIVCKSEYTTMQSRHLVVVVVLLRKIAVG